ncbi:MAG: His Kinase (phospho-acceptor) protein [Deltaproteobacteria bacterium]|nr:His Kinase (phospho-acceptor) protein [Deltaproteobacteria bacterium]
MPSKPTLLIVDDEERNIRLLKAMLMAKNYDFLEASHGEEALRLASEISMDMILLDVMMPQMDGFEVCHRLKQDEKTRAIPIIMVTALSEKQHRIKAMEVGADDFISKPVDYTELTIRVSSLLRIKSYQDELSQNLQIIAAKNAKLEELERVRDGLVHMIIHDLRNPLSAISAYLQLALIDPGGLSGANKEKVERCFHFCQELEHMIQNLLNISKMEEGKMDLNREPTSLQDLTTEILERFAPTVEERQISLFFSGNGNLPPVIIDRSIIKRVITNLVDNEIRYTPNGGAIEVGVKAIPDKGAICLTVKDSGDGIPAEYQEKIFDKFEQVKLKKEGNRAGSSGLGLTFCKMAVETHGGKIWVESEGPGKGAAFQALLPLSAQ